MVNYIMEKEALKENFWVAIQDGDISNVQQIINKGVKLHCHLNDRHITALHYCAEVGNTQLFQWLLAKGASLKKRDRWMDSPLHYACKHNHVDIVKLILRNVKNALLLDVKGHDQHLPLFYAFQNQNIEVLRCIVKFVAENKIKFQMIYDSFVRYVRLNNNGKERCSFIAAVKKENKRIQNLIINTMMKVDKMNLFKELCIYVEEEMNDTDTRSIIESMLKDLTQVNKEKWLQSLSLESFIEPVKILLLKNTYGYSMSCLQRSLLHAVTHKNFEVAEILLRENVDMDGQANIFLQCLKHENPKFLKMLIDKTANFDSWPTCKHEEILISAVSIGNVECVEVIGRILGKKLVNTCSGLLHIAIQKKSIDLFNCLLDIGATICAGDGKVCVTRRKDPLFLAVQSGETNIVEKLLSFCTVPTSKEDHIKLINLAIVTENISMVELVLKLLPENILNEDSATCISAINTKNISLFKSLMILGLKINTSDSVSQVNYDLPTYPSEFSQTNLQAAIDTGIYEFVELCCKAGTALSKYGSEINKAVRLKSIDILMCLLEYKGKETFQNIVLNSYSWSPLHEAITKGNKKMIDTILESSSLVDVIKPFLQKMGNSLIRLAAKGQRKQRLSSECSTTDECLKEDVLDSKYSSKELVTILLRKGIKVNVEMLQCLCTELEIRDTVIWKELISTIDHEDWFISDRTLFCQACANKNMELAYLILQHQPSLTKDNGALMYLHATILTKNREIVKKILEIPGIDVNECLPVPATIHLPYTWRVNNKYGIKNSALFIAAMQKAPEICIDLLQHNSDKDMANENGFLPLHIAIINDSVGLLELFSENSVALDNEACKVYISGQTIGGSPLHISTQLEKVECTKILLRHGASVNTCCKEHERTPLFYVAKWKQTNSKIIEVTKMFLKSGADINHIDRNGISLLSVAVEHKNITLIQMLLQNGMKRKVIQTLGTENILKSVKNLNLEILNELVKYGCNLEVDDLNVSHLIAHCRKEDEGQICDMITVLLKHGKMNLEKDYRGLTALHQCAKRNLESVAKLLISSGCDVNATIPEHAYHYRFERNLEGGNAVDLAINYKNFNILKILLESKFKLTNDNILHELVDSCSINVNIGRDENQFILMVEEAIEVLLKKGIDINFKNKSGETALHKACQMNTIWIVEILLKHHCDCEIPTYKTSRFQCYTALQIACEQGNLEIAELLVKHNCSIDLLTTEMETLIHLLVKQKSEGNKHPSVHSFYEESEYDSDEYMDINYSDDDLDDTCDSGSVEDWYIELNTNQSNEEEYTNKWRNLVTHMVTNGIDIDAVNSNGWSVLHYAVDRGDLLMVCHLLKHCRIDQKNGQLTGRFPFCTPVQIASKKGYMEIMEVLIQQKCSIQVLDLKQKTLLHDLTECSLNKDSDVMMKMSNTRELLINGIDVNTEDDAGKTALFNAVLNNDHEMVKLMLEYNFDFSKEATRQKSSLLLAARMHYCDILNALLQKGAKINTADDQKLIALHCICSKPSVQYTCNRITSYHKIYKYIHHKCTKTCFKSITYMISKGSKVNAQDSKGETPLHKACQSELFEAVRILLEHGGDPTILSKSLDTPLACCVKHRDNEDMYLIVKTLLEFQNGRYGKKCMTEETLWHCMTNCSPIISKILLQHGANPNFRLTEGNASLHIACNETCKASLITTLLSYCADINLQNYHGETPLHIACNNDNSEAVRLLLKCGAIPDIQDHNGWTVYHKCTSQGNHNLLEYVLEHRGNVDLRTTKEFMGIEVGTTPLVMCLGSTRYLSNIAKLLLQNGASPDQCDRNGDPIILIAVKNRSDFSIVEKLIECCNNIDKHGKSGLGPIHYAVRNTDINVLRCLIEHNCDINSQIHLSAGDNGGLCPLHLAVKMFNLPMVDVLIQNGCSLFVEDNTGKTPMQYCINESGNFEQKSIVLWPTLLKAGGLVKIINGDQCLPILIKQEDLTNLLIETGCKIQFSGVNSEHNLQEQVDKIVEKQQQPLPLMRLAGNTVRCNIRPNALHSAKCLPLPESIIKFLTFESRNIQLEHMTYAEPIANLSFIEQFQRQLMSQLMLQQILGIQYGGGNIYADDDEDIYQTYYYSDDDTSYYDDDFDDSYY